ncbi:MAG: MBL fold metallo-hydrolase [Firmicutes bacterium]|nr:MBL fold metallo-hydrolase [Bacillota bacterium]
MKIMFCGATEEVTGSCHLLNVGNYKFLLDCGLFQGGKATEEKNYEPFPFNPAEIDFMVLSHAHIDHCGRIPLLVKHGFRGKIYCTDATADLLEIMLLDSAHIQEMEAERKNRKNERAGRPLIEPLYTTQDAMESLALVAPVLYDQLVEINESIKIVFNDAGHILGSAIIEIFAEENGENSKIVFSGDLGVDDRPILRDPKVIKKADVVIMETTYGNRLHEENKRSVNALIDIVRKTVKRGGNVVIPSFAVGRTQELLYEFNRIYDHTPELQNELKNMKVYVDSPMSVKATEVFMKNAQVYDDDMKSYILKGDNPLDFKNLNFSLSTDQSRAINDNKEPKIIISASGMCDAGRIRHHLKHNLWDSRNSIVFVGYQAEGSLGRYITDGAKNVTLFGEEITVNAEIYDLDGFSGHADRDGLVSWFKGFQKPPKQVFLVHGERESKYAFRDYVKEETGYECTVVDGISEFELETGELLSEYYSEITENKDEEISSIKSRIATIEDSLDSILRSADLAVSADLSAKRVSEIKNILLELEKSTYKLGAIATEEDRKVE